MTKALSSDSAKFLLGKLRSKKENPKQNKNPNEPQQKLDPEEFFTRFLKQTYKFKF